MAELQNLTGGKAMPKHRVKRHSVTQPMHTSYRYIPLTQGQTAIVDAIDYDRLSALTWHAHWNPHTNSFYARSWSFGRIMMHKFILGYGPGKQCDHINHETLDNRRENLRVCTPAQNSQFRRKRSDNISGFKGVYFKKGPWRTGGKWCAVITVNKKTIVLGYFDSPKEASKIYEEAAKKYFGEFAHK